MRMIDPGRTNVVPLTMIAFCIGLLILRTVVIYYGTFYQPAQENMIVWNQPKKMDRSRKDLLSKPTLYFFCDGSDQWNKAITQVAESMLFHNREVAALIEKSVVPVKVVLNGENNDVVSNSLKNALHVSNCPDICVALPNGKRIDRTSWQSDRMFLAFLRDALRMQPRRAAIEAMGRCDWGLACRGFELDHINKADAITVDLYDTMYWAIALRHHKDDGAARKVLEDALARNKTSFKGFVQDDNWPEPCIKFLLGDLTYEELMKVAKDKKKKSRYSYRPETAHYICGANYLLDGKIEPAKKELRIIAKSNTASHLYAAKLARAELRALGEDFPEKDDDYDDDEVEDN